MKNTLQLFATFLLVSIFQLSFAQNNVIKLNSGDLILNELDPQSTIGDVLIENSSAGDYYLVQFTQIPNESQQNELSSNGVRLLEYIPNKTWIANLSQAVSQATIESMNIRAIEPWKADYKTASTFDLSGAPEWVYEGKDQYRLMIDRQLDVDQAAFEALMTSNGVLVEEAINGENNEYLNITIDDNKVEWLKSLAEVKFISYGEAPPVPDDIRARGLHTLNLLGPNDAFGRDLNGDGVSIAIADNGVGPHIDRKGRITMHTTTNTGTHGDMTTGIAVGAGNLNPRFKGHATHSYLHYYNISGYPHIAQAVSNLNNRGVVITSTSFSQGCNNYDGTSRAIDQQVNANKALLHVFSAGNSANSNCGYGAGTPWGNITGGRKIGKNVIATGNLDYRGLLTNSSSRGPADDGRIKPDICANGTSQMSTDPNNGYSPGGGTSAAAPSIAGISAVLYQGYRELNNNQDPSSGLIKAAMLNTARDVGNVGPDFFFGWGVVNAHRAMLLLEENRYLDSSVSQNSLNTHDIVINQNLQSLKLMVYWTDLEGSTVSSKALVNDLDLRVVTPTNDTIFPYVLDPTPNSAALSSPATRGVDDLNNVEQVQIDSASAGTYRVLVNGTAIPIGSQSYHLLWETIEDSITLTYPAGGEPLIPFTQETIRWDAPEGVSGNFTVEFSANNGASWTNLGTAGSNVRYFNITVPNITTGNALFRVSRNGISGTSPKGISILRTPQNVRADFICPDSIGISWNAVSGATSYDVFLLGDTHMDSVGTSTTTSLTLFNVDFSQENWVAVRARTANAVGERSNAVTIPQNTFNCPLAFDLSIDKIIAPAGYVPGCNSSKTAVRIEVSNLGDSVLSNVPVELNINNTAYSDTIPGPIASLATVNFTFKDSITLSATLPTSVSAVVKLATDQNSFNDSISDDVILIPSQVVSAPYNMDFETINPCATSNTCGSVTCNLGQGWVNIPNTMDDHDMRVDFGGTPSSGTGPSIDANPGTTTGRYIYSEASNNCYNLTSEVLSPCLDLSSTIRPEFDFAYHMQGTSVGLLRVDIFRNGSWTNDIINPLFGNIGTTWNRRTIDLSPYKGDTVTIRFRIETGSSWSSDIAIDDINLIDQGVGLGEIETDNYRLFPNPSEGLFRIQLNEGNIGELRVFDLQGRNIYRTRINDSYGEIDLSNFDKGIYIIEFKDGEVREKVMVN
jgi:hypothetical protein